jgi:hypothetical protein
LTKLAVQPRSRTESDGVGRSRTESDGVGQSRTESDRVGQKSDKVGQKSDKVGHRSDKVGHRSDKVGHRSDKVGHRRSGRSDRQGIPKPTVFQKVWSLWSDQCRLRNDRQVWSIPIDWANHCHRKSDFHRAYRYQCLINRFGRNADQWLHTDKGSILACDDSGIGDRDVTLLRKRKYFSRAIYSKLGPGPVWAGTH